MSSFRVVVQPQAQSDMFEAEIRQLLFTNLASTYRILFTIQGQEVHIQHVRHGSRRYSGETTWEEA